MLNAEGWRVEPFDQATRTRTEAGALLMERLCVFEPKGFIRRRHVFYNQMYLFTRRKSFKCSRRCRRKKKWKWGRQPRCNWKITTHYEDSSDPQAIDTAAPTPSSHTKQRRPAHICGVLLKQLPLLTSLGVSLPFHLPKRLCVLTCITRYPGCCPTDLTPAGIRPIPSFVSLSPTKGGCSFQRAQKSDVITW